MSLVVAMLGDAAAATKRKGMIRGGVRPLSRRLQHLEEITRRHRSEHIVRTLQEQQLRDIDPSSLSATLDAHRASNLALKIRRIDASSPRPKKRDATGSNKNVESSRASLPRRRPTRQGDTAELRGVAQHVLPQYSHRRVSESQLRSPPWKSGDTTVPGDRRQALHQDISEYAHWVSLSKEEVKLRRSAASAVQEVLQQEFSDISFVSFGSLESGMSIPSSDIDIGFFIPSLAKGEDERGPSNLRPAARKAIQKKLVPLADALKRTGSFWDVMTIPASRMPLVSANLRGCNIGLQFVSYPSQLPPQAALVKSYCAEFPQLQPLFVTVRAALTIRGLFESKEQGLGSYRLLVLLVAFLKLNPRSARESLAMTLVDFLQWFAEIDTRQLAVSADPPALFEKRTADIQLSLQARKAIDEDPVFYFRNRLGLVDANVPHALVLQDPADLAVDIGRNCVKVLDIQATFARMADVLSKWLDHKALGSMSHADSMRRYLLGAFPHYEERRRLSAQAWISRHGSYFVPRKRDMEKDDS